jgi:hypothetical protein
MVHTLTVSVDDAPAVAPHNILHTGGEHDLRARHPRRPDPVYHDLEVLHLLADDLQGVDERREDHDRRAVLIVVEDRYVELLFEALLYLEAPRR